MSASAITLAELATSRRWQQNFLAIVPAVESHAKVRFRGCDVADREEQVAEAVAAACLSYYQLSQQKKLDQAFTSTLADYAVRRVTQDRHVGGHQSSRDALSPLARKRHNFTITSLPIRDDGQDGWQAVVWEDRKTSPADVAAFRLDFAQWLRTLQRRDRRIIDHMAAGYGTTAVARRFGVSLGRVSQLRRRYERQWAAFQHQAA
jgi:hypothetical protein